jgi:hypothetical protein
MCRDSAGMPVAVQVAAPPYQDEVVLRVMALLQASVVRKNARLPFVDCAARGLLHYSCCRVTVNRVGRS